MPKPSARGPKSADERHAINFDLAASGEPIPVIAKTPAFAPLTDQEKEARRQAAAQRLMDSWQAGAEPAKLAKDSKVDLTLWTPEEEARWDALYEQAAKGTPAEKDEAVRLMIAEGIHEPSGDTAQPSDEPTEFERWLVHKSRGFNSRADRRYQRSRKDDDDRDEIVARQVLMQRALVRTQEFPEDGPALKA